MINTTKLIRNKQALPNVRFWDEDKVGNNVFFVPESISKSESDIALSKFMSTQIKGYYQQIVVPGIISNFLGKKLSSQKYFINLKAELPNFVYTRVPAKQLNDERTNIFDLSGLIDDLLSTAKSRSNKMVFNEFNKLIGSATLDYKPERKNILLIIGNPLLDNDSSDFLNLLIYMDKLSAGKIKTGLDGIVYFINNKYYPLAVPDEKETDKLKFLRNIIGQLKLVKTKLSKGVVKAIDTEEELDATKKAIETLAMSETNASSKQKEIKSLLKQHTTLQGTFDEKINQLFSTDVSDKISDLSSEANKKYNGNVTLNIPHKTVFNSQKIVGMDEVGNYDKQRTELTENIDELVEDLIHGTLENDPDVDIKVLGIKTKIVDDNKNRYKEYQVKVQHKDYGQTTNKPYTISFRIPVPVNGKYIKIGGNNYILINQLFPKPIQKVAPNLIRFYTHFSVSSLKIKNAKLTVGNGFVEIEDKFVQQLKSVNAIKLENMSNSDKDEIAAKYDLRDLHDFKYSKMTIKA